MIATVLSSVVLAFQSGEVSEALLLILTLIILEGLLSVDNALAIASMASHLPEHQQKKALRYGIIGAYLFRGIVLAGAAWLMQNEWVKWVGAAYLVYLGVKNLSTHPQSEKHDDQQTHHIKAGLLGTIISIELMDLSLSIDNVIVALAAVNGSVHIPEKHHIWVVCIGVFIGILALRLVAGWCLGIIKKYPILAKTAFMLVGFVGLYFMIEMASEHFLGAFKFAQIKDYFGPIKYMGIFSILILSLVYEKSPQIKKRTEGFFHNWAKVNYVIAWIIESPFRLLSKFYHFIVPSGKH